MVGKGLPIMYFHGTASSRLESLLLEKLAKKAQLQIIGVDRPGYGLSTFAPRTRLGAFNGDINFLADYLHIKQFGILGWSGGGVFALAYLAFFPERVTKTVIVGTPSLPFDGAMAHNTPFARFAMKIPFLGIIALKRMSLEVLKANGDISSFLRSKVGKQMLETCSKDDLMFFSNLKWFTFMYQSMAEAFRQGNKGVRAVFEEHQLLMKPWDFSFSRISGSRLFIWHGADDKTCLVSNAYKIFRRAIGSHLEIFEGKGHCVMFANLQKMGKIFRSD